jgi:hypothetical protein
MNARPKNMANRFAGVPNGYGRVPSGGPRQCSSREP